MSSRASLVVVYDVVSVRAGCGLALFPRVTSGTIGRSIPRGRLLFVLVSSRASRRPSLAAGFETVRWRAWNPRSGPAEVDARRLYVPAGYPSMFEYCVAELRLSEDAAYKRIQAARAARRFPVLFTALAEGRLHLAGVCLLASHLTPENTEERVAAAAHRPKPEIERLLAERCLRPELPAMTLAIPPLPNGQLALGQVGMPEVVRDAVGELVPEQVEATATRPKPAPPLPERFALPLVGKRPTTSCLNGRA